MQFMDGGCAQCYPRAIQLFLAEPPTAELLAFASREVPSTVARSYLAAEVAGIRISALRTGEPVTPSAPRRR